MSLIGITTQVSEGTARDTVLADLGVMFVATSPTPGTGIISSTPITLAAAATAPTMVVYNGNQAGGPNVYPLWLKLTETAASTGGTQLNYQFHIDTVNRYVSGGTVLTAGANFGATNSGSLFGSKATIAYGAITGAAAVNDKFVSGNCRCRVGLIDILGDMLMFTFGSPTPMAAGPSLQTTATVGVFAFSVAPVVVAPGHSMVMTIWQPTTFTTGVTHEVEFGYAEK
jgi:hypothetical protein